MRHLLALDVATKYTGYARFTTPENEWVSDGWELSCYGLIRGGSTEDWVARVLKINISVRAMTSPLWGKDGAEMQTILEYPSFQAGSRGMAASRGGDVAKLAFACGALYVSLAALGMADLVTFQQWNGQLPKRVTCARAEKFGLPRVDPAGIDNNWVDAVMMGKWWLERNVSVVSCHWPKRKDW